MDRAAALYQAGRIDEAASLCGAILAAEPRHFWALHLASVIALRSGRAEECVGLASRALEVDPRSVDVLCNRGVALRMLDRVDEAMADYRRALERDPRSASACNLMGVALAALNRNAEAIAWYDRALSIDAALAPAHFNRALSRLLLGDFERGLPDYEWRWTGSDTQGPKRALPQPQWQGEDMSGRTILVWAEQGLGDTIQMSRYVPLLAARGARVVLEVHPPLLPLLRALPGVVQALALGDPLPPFDLHCPMLSLPLAFGTRIDSIPAAIPYLGAPRERVETWRSRLAGLRGPRVGIAWSGARTLRNDRRRSIPLETLAPLRSGPWSLVSLQKEYRETDLAHLEAGGPIARFDDALGDFADTAALVDSLDLVISVDTAVAHLAGALGKSTWVLLPFAPDWRWLLQREDSPWYPGMRLFRQPRPGEWDAVIDRVAAEMTPL